MLCDKILQVAILFIASVDCTEAPSLLFQSSIPWLSDPILSIVYPVPRLLFFFPGRVSLEYKMLADRCQPVLIYLSSVQHLDFFVSCTALAIKLD